METCFSLCIKVRNIHSNTWKTLAPRQKGFGEYVKKKKVSDALSQQADTWSSFAHTWKAFQMFCDTSAQSGNDQCVFIAFWLLVSNDCVLTYCLCIKTEREKTNKKWKRKTQSILMILINQANLRCLTLRCSLLTCELIPAVSYLCLEDAFTLLSPWKHK